jgi:hypothetical protein
VENWRVVMEVGGLVGVMVVGGKGVEGVGGGWVGVMVVEGMEVVVMVVVGWVGVMEAED